MTEERIVETPEEEKPTKEGLFSAVMKFLKKMYLRELAKTVFEEGQGNIRDLDKRMVEVMREPGKAEDGELEQLIGNLLKIEVDTQEFENERDLDLANDDPNSPLASRMDAKRDEMDIGNRKFDRDGNEIDEERGTYSEESGRLGRKLDARSREDELKEYKDQEVDVLAREGTKAKSDKALDGERDYKYHLLRAKDRARLLVEGAEARGEAVDIKKIADIAGIEPEDVVFSTPEMVEVLNHYEAALPEFDGDTGENGDMRKVFLDGLRKRYADNSGNMTSVERTQVRELIGDLERRHAEDVDYHSRVVGGEPMRREIRRRLGTIEGGDEVLTGDDWYREEQIIVADMIGAGHPPENIDRMIRSMRARREAETGEIRYQRSFSDHAEMARRRFVDEEYGGREDFHYRQVMASVEKFFDKKKEDLTPDDYAEYIRHRIKESCDGGQDLRDSSRNKAMSELAMLLGMKEVFKDFSHDEGGMITNELRDELRDEMEAMFTMHEIGLNYGHLGDLEGLAKMLKGIPYGTIKHLMGMEYGVGIRGRKMVDGEWRDVVGSPGDCKIGVAEVLDLYNQARFGVGKGVEGRGILDYEEETRVRTKDDLRIMLMAHKTKMIDADDGQGGLDFSGFRVERNNGSFEIFEGESSSAVAEIMGLSGGREGAHETETNLDALMRETKWATDLAEHWFHISGSFGRFTKTFSVSDHGLNVKDWHRKHIDNRYDEMHGLADFPELMRIIEPGYRGFEDEIFGNLTSTKTKAMAGRNEALLKDYDLDDSDVSWFVDKMMKDGDGWLMTRERMLGQFEALYEKQQVHGHGGMEYRFAHLRKKEQARMKKLSKVMFGGGFDWGDGVRFYDGGVDEGAVFAGREGFRRMIQGFNRKALYTEQPIWDERLQKWMDYTARAAKAKGEVRALAGDPTNFALLAQVGRAYAHFDGERAGWMVAEAEKYIVEQMRFRWLGRDKLKTGDHGRSLKFMDERTDGTHFTDPVLAEAGEKDKAFLGLNEEGVAVYKRERWYMERAGRDKHLAAKPFWQVDREIELIEAMNYVSKEQRDYLHGLVEGGVVRELAKKNPISGFVWEFSLDPIAEYTRLGFLKNRRFYIFIAL